MKTKTEMDNNSMTAKIGGALLGSIFCLFNGDLLHIDFNHMLQFGGWEALLKLTMDLAKVGLAGMVGAAGGIIGKKYLFPWIEKVYKKVTNKKPS